MSDNNIVLFNRSNELLGNLIEKVFENYNIRVFSFKNEIYFFGKDAALALTYTNTKQAIITHCKRAISIKDLICGKNDTGSSELTPNEIKDLQALGVDPQTKVIDKKDLFTLVMRSGKDEAEKFQDWVFDVIDEISKTGKYELTSNYDTPNIVNKLNSYDKEFADIKKQLNLIVTNGISTNRPTIKLVGMNKRELNGGVDIETFCKNINTKYNRSYSRNVIYNILRALNYIKEGSTEPTDDAYRNGFIDLAVGYIFYSDGTRGKTVKTIITDKIIDTVINYMKGKRYI